jgi:ribose transport system substrate-binding protein
MNRVLVLLGVAVALLAGCKKEDAGNGSGGGASGAPTTGSSSAGELRIAVIPKGTTHAFWRAVQAGAEQAGKDTSAQIIWKGPLKEDDRTAQIQVVQQFVGQGVSGIVVAPLDSKALLQPIELAGSQHIPVVIMDSALDGQVGKDFVSFVATDNHKGGQMAGEQLAKILSNTGSVVLLRYAEGSASTEAREAGFLEAIAKYPDIKLLVQNRYGGATADSAAKAALNMIDQIKQADGIFTPNESTTNGMLAALQTAGLAGQKKFVGFDATSQLVKSLENGEVQALIAQNPYKMGYECVKTLADSIRGKAVDQRVDTGVFLITKENLNDPPIQELLKRS